MSAMIRRKAPAPGIATAEELTKAIKTPFCKLANETR